MPEFLALAFGLCAGLTSYSSPVGIQPTVAIGYVSHGQCIVHLVVGEDGTLPFGSHAIAVRFIEGGAVVVVDDEPETVLLVGEPV